MRSFKSNENIHKKEGGSYYVVSANKASSVTLQSPGNESRKKYTAILQTHVKVERFHDSRALCFYKCRFTSDLKLIVLLHVKFQLCYV